MEIVTLIIGLAVGAVGTWLLIRRETAEKIALVQGSREQFRDELKAISGDAMKETSEQLARLAAEQRRTELERGATELAKRSEEFKRLVEPMANSLKKVESEVQQLERERRQTQGQMAEMFRGLTEGMQTLRSETGNLVTALRRPQTRGSWGEIQLRRVVEMAGMVEHCDFLEQETLATPDGRLRPDILVRLPGGKTVVVDSKAPLDAYLDAIEAPEGADREAQLARHARQVRDHIGKLASKAYGRGLEATPEFVVMFLPSEAIYHAALQHDASLLEHGVEQQVLIATPTTLIALLRAVHYGWKQELIAVSAREIAGQAQELHRRFATFLDPLARVGRQLTSATSAYNQAIGSLEARVLPQLRRIEEAGAKSEKDLEAPEAIDTPARMIAAPELSEAQLAALPPGDDDEIVARDTRADAA